MSDLSFHLTGNVWKYSGKTTWFFVHVPKDESDHVKFFTSDLKRGWGSVRVEVCVGNTKWQTSIFPDKEEGKYLLPFKKSVRDAEGLKEGDDIAYFLRILA